MIIVLNTTAPNFTVENYYGCETLLVTPDLNEAVNRTLREARHFEAIIRITVGNHASSISLLTGPRALLWKIYAVSFITYLIARIVGIASIYHDFSRASRTRAFTAPAQNKADFSALKPDQLVATPLYLDLPDNASHEQIQDAVTAALRNCGLTVIANDPQVARLEAVILCTGHGANFVESPYDHRPEIYTLMEETERAARWLDAAALSYEMPTVTGDEFSNAFLFWTAIEPARAAGYGTAEPTIACATCLFSQPLADFQSRVRCVDCDRPTCDFCNDSLGHCLNCTPYLALPVNRSFIVNHQTP